MPEGGDEDVVELIEGAPTPGKGWENKLPRATAIRFPIGPCDG